VDYDRRASFYINAKIEIGDTSVLRTYTKTCTIKAGDTTAEII
jgi:hypothetical protein